MSYAGTSSASLSGSSPTTYAGTGTSSTTSCLVLSSPLAPLPSCYSLLSRSGTTSASFSSPLATNKDPHTAISWLVLADVAIFLVILLTTTAISWLLLPHCTLVLALFLLLSTYILGMPELVSYQQLALASVSDSFRVGITHHHHILLAHLSNATLLVSPHCQWGECRLQAEHSLPPLRRGAAEVSFTMRMQAEQSFPPRMGGCCEFSEGLFLQDEMGDQPHHQHTTAPTLLSLSSYQPRSNKEEQEAHQQECCFGLQNKNGITSP